MSAAPRPKRRIRACIYIRVSKAREEMISPENQLHAAQVLCQREGLEVIEVVEDLDLSGRDFAKRKIDYIIRGAEGDLWDVVVVWRWSRFGRNMLDSMLNLRALKDAGGKARAATEDFDDDTTLGRFTRDQMLLIAQLESDQVGDVWKEAHARRERQGLPHSGFPRFGYQYDQVTKQYLLDPLEGPLLRQLYTRYVDGGDAVELARWLNARQFRTKRGSTWTATPLLRMLDTGFGAGLFGMGRTAAGRYERWVRGSHDAVIDMAVWVAYRDRRAGAPPMRGGQGRYALSGLLRCAECGNRLRARGQAKRSGQVFECGRHADDPEACPGVYASRHVVEARVTAWLEREASLRSDSTCAEAGARVPRPAGRTPSDVGLVAAQTKLVRLVELDGEGLVDKPTFEQRRQQLVREVATRKFLLGAADPILPTRDCLLRALARWRGGSEQERRVVLQELLSSIIVARGRANSVDKYKFVPRWALGPA